MNRSRALALGLLGVLLLTACATANPSPPPPASSQRVRCLNDPRDTDMRPLIFLFCVESP
ncbi:MAG: hypothetical protein ACREJE_13760 [Candidatus Rokuibacteriota bacterium]